MYWKYNLVKPLWKIIGHCLVRLPSNSTPTKEMNFCSDVPAGVYKNIDSIVCNVIERKSKCPFVNGYMMIYLCSGMP